MIKKYGVKTILSITLFALFCLHPFISNASNREQDALEMEVRFWAFDAVTKLMTYNYENFADNLKQNKHLLTQRGCKTFLWTLYKYGLSDDLFKRKESLLTNELWRIRSVPKKILLINLKKLNEAELERRKAREDDIIWHVWVPVLIKRQKGLLKTQYRYKANLEVKMIQSAPHRFIINRWLPLEKGAGISIKHKKKYFQKKEYPECDKSPYQDLDDYKGP